MSEIVVEVPSPTEVATDMEAELEGVEPAEVGGDLGMAGSLEHAGGVGHVENGHGAGEAADRRARKREREQVRKGKELKKEEISDEESPTKRANEGDCPLSGRELRYLLNQHMCEFREAWGGITG